MLKFIDTKQPTGDFSVHRANKWLGFISKDGFRVAAGPEAFGIAMTLTPLDLRQLIQFIENENALHAEKTERITI